MEKQFFYYKGYVVFYNDFVYWIYNTNNEKSRFYTSKFFIEKAISQDAVEYV